MSDTQIKLPQRNLRHILVTAGILLFSLVFIYFLVLGLRNDPTQIPSVLINKPAKEFTVQWLQGQEFLDHSTGETFSLKDFKGRPIILNFWASWCYSCRHEARDFEEFWLAYKDSGVIVAGIAIQDTEPAAREFARQYGKTYILGMDVDGRAAIDYGVTGVPETFVINRQGEIVYKEAGPVTAEKLAEFAKLVL
ncbi:MAG: TlpA family protein disulfide reductase [Oligoflexus sp.]